MTSPDESGIVGVGGPGYRGAHVRAPRGTPPDVPRALAPGCDGSRRRGSLPEMMDTYCTIEENQVFPPTLIDKVYDFK